MKKLPQKEADWVANRTRPEETKKYLRGGKTFINADEIRRLLRQDRPPETSRIREIVAQALEIRTLSLEETAALLRLADPELLSEVRQAALAIKLKVYDNRIVTFAPLYTGDFCVNDCAYCGFRRSNQELERSLLDLGQIRRETEVLAGKIGHKRLILVYGEHPASGIDYMLDSIRAVYSVKIPSGKGFNNIRRVNVNAPVLPVEELERLREAGLGTYQVFQETYDPELYAKLHPAATIKGNYARRLYCMHRAFEAGIDDVGLGALFGLGDWRFEVLGLVAHARELEKTFGIGPHTFSFPRLQPALGVNLKLPAVSDDDFLRLIAVLRLAVPYTGMIITARETAAIRRESIALGITQTDASSRIGIGDYAGVSDGQHDTRQQFRLGDTRSLDELVGELARMGYITSFCTAGYRCGRTGKKIMETLRCGKEGMFCKLNAVLTFREWLDDFASASTREAGEDLIGREIAEIRQKYPSLYGEFLASYERTVAGERDLYF